MKTQRRVNFITGDISPLTTMHKLLQTVSVINSLSQRYFRFFFLLSVLFFCFFRCCNSCCHSYPHAYWRSPSSHAYGVTIEQSLSLQNEAFRNDKRSMCREDFLFNSLPP
ncbi:Hypothetical protein, putative [Bodo saltans]|uniref:Uncharacterized protein n=1 Tax=Bodo saltans TaxID=75058 RepID=A0A0S4JQ96_BODSA|nr:Hypothetical protein, putative [Bodo saltans]|eukprot:CUG93694.1 Hypothetical protein, putative [Bodo saltans]